MIGLCSATSCYSVPFCASVVTVRLSLQVAAPHPVIPGLLLLGEEEGETPSELGRPNCPVALTGFL